MLIIIEGPDGSGKSTLARDVATCLEARYPGHKVELLHAGPPRHHPLDEYLRSLSAYRPGEDHHIVLDRWHIGERVYPYTRGRPTLLDEPAWWSIDRYLRRLGAFVIMCDPGRDAVAQTLRTRGDDDHLRELDRVLRLFTDAYEACHLLMHEYHWSHHQPDMFIDAAAAFEREATRLNSFVTYLGHPRPTGLLLGDVRHELSRPGVVIGNLLDPAFLPFRGTSGHYLLGALEDALPDYRWHIGIANACDVDDPVDLWDALGRPPTVALGRNAQRRLRGTPINPVTVPHPQYVRRFHHRQRAAYGNLIKQSLQLGASSCLTLSPAGPVPTFTTKS